jgi:hypothetical protein
MEGSSAPVDARARRDPSAMRATQIGLVIASIGAVLIIFNLFGLAIVGIFLAIGGAVIAAPGNFTKGWYVTVALGAIVAGLSRLVAEGAETIGGWLAVFGSATVLIGTMLGFPTRDEE